MDSFEQHFPFRRNEFEIKKSFDSLNSFDENDWESFYSYIDVTKYLVGEFVIKEGDVDRSLYIVSKGVLDVIALNHSKHSVSLSKIGQGAVFGELGFLDAQPRSASVMTLSEAEVLKLTYESFERMREENLKLTNLLLYDLALILTFRFRSLTASILGS